MILLHRLTPAPSLLLPLILIQSLLLFTTLQAVSVVDRQHEPTIEHQVTLENAYKEARNIKLYPGIKPGCNPCTRDEMNYCQNNSVIEDHCCCDNYNYNEELGFVEHTCFIKPEPCQIRAGNCAEYYRLRDCCCHTYLVSDWKYRAGGAGSLKTSYFLLSLSSCLVIFIKIFF